MTAEVRELLRSRQSGVGHLLSHDELHAHLSAVVRSLRAERAGVCLHAAAVTTASGGVLATSATGGGKSTLALALALRGGRFVSDDTVWLDGRTVAGVGAPVAVRRSSPWFDDVAAVVGDDGSSRLLVRPELLGAPPSATSCEVHTVVVPTHRIGAAELEVLSPAVAFCHLAAAALVDLTPCHLMALAELVAQVPTAAIRYGSVDDSLRLVDLALGLDTPRVDPVAITGDAVRSIGLLDRVQAIVFDDMAVVWRSGFPQMAVVEGWSTAGLDVSPAWPVLEQLGFAERRGD